MGKQQLFHQSKLLTVFETNTAQKMKFSIKDFFSKCDTFTEGIPNRKLHFLCCRNGQIVKLSNFHLEVF